MQINYLYVTVILPSNKHCITCVNTYYFQIIMSQEEVLINQYNTIQFTILFYESVL